MSSRAVLIRGNGRGFCPGADVQPDQILKRREHIGEEVENDELSDTATALAEKLAAGPTTTLGLIKREIAQAQTQDLDTTLTFEARCQQTAFNTDDFAEGIGAHHQKRKPAFAGQ